MENKKEEIVRILIDEDSLRHRIAELAAQINRDYAGKTVTAVGILKGSMIFMADLVRLLNLDVRLDFIEASSYGLDTESGGVVTITKDMTIDVEGSNILIVEDIMDTGRTLSHIKHMFANRGAADVRIVTLLDKPERRVSDVEVDYVGFEIENAFVIGYGLDYAEKYRNLPYIGILSIENSEQ